VAATIVFLEHELQARLGIAYMAHAFAQRWERSGHRVLYHRGAGTPPAGDVAILHVDLTVVPDSYRALDRHYARVVNSATWDIRKSRYSGCRVARGDVWAGQVLIKTDANHGGHVDDALRRLAAAEGAAGDIAARAVMDSYYLCDSMRDVPGAIWDTPGVLVEKFIPERDALGNYLRVWTFFGPEERSTRYLSRDLLIRAGNYVSREAVPVPDEMRAMREKLGFDFGKFDYVRHEGGYVLLDANRTPGAPARLADDPEVAASFDRVARGIEAFL
jgi:hypothetical protein